MNTLLSALRSVTLGVALTLAPVGAVLADDTDIFLADADPSITGAKPNILFIVDTSGSMGSQVLTQSAWDPSLTFAGCYRTDALYFSTNGNPPGCWSGNYVWKTANQCQASFPALDGLGQYQDNIQAWRNRAGTRNDRWIDLSSNGRNRPLDCQADRGIHGDGGTGTWAADGAPGPWSTNPANEIAWNQDYTIYDGNWLNWNAGDGTVISTRIQVVKDVSRQLLTNLTGVNVGIMRFNRNVFANEDGGPVIFALSDIDVFRDQMIATIDALPANGNTPLSETMYEAAQYYMGRGVLYGNLMPDNLSVAESRVGDVITSNTYKRPVNFQCQKNYIVYLTDGAPVADVAANNLVPALPGFGELVGPTCDGTGQGRCLDDLAEYLYKHDLDDNLPGLQNVTTYTIGFTIDLPLMADTARRGGGEYRLADDTASLTAVLTDIVLSILDDSTTFTAPAVPVNAFNRTQNLDDVFVSVFRPDNHAHWSGNLKKYRLSGGKLVGQDDLPAVDPDTGFFSTSAFSFWSATPDGDRVTQGGAAKEQPVWSSRNLYTSIDGNVLTSANNRFNPTNDALIDELEDLGVDEGEAATIIQWAMGLDVNDEDDDGATDDIRGVMGDPLHVRPQAVIYGGTAENPDAVVFVSTNDGFLHAVDPEDGSELWAFMPKELLARLPELFDDPVVSNKRYGLDSDIRAHIANNDLQPGITGAEKVYLIFGMRRGGNKLFALDVTDRWAPKLAWTIDGDLTPGFEDLGQTWSTPQVAQVNVGGSAKEVVIIGGGYDTGQDNAGYRTDSVGNAIYMIDLETGNLLWSAGQGSGHDLRMDGNLSNAAMEHSIPAPVRVIDLTGDRIADRMYAVDTGGRVWRFDIRNGAAAADLVEGGLIGSIGAADIGAPTGADVRRFYAGADVVAILDGEFPYLAINVGSGTRARPLDGNVQDEFYSIRDYDIFGVRNTEDYGPPTLRAELVDITDEPEPVLDPDEKGWRLRLVQAPGEKILTESFSFDGTVFFTSFAPRNVADVCSAAGGENRLYRVNVRDGAPLPPDTPTPPVDPPSPQDRFEVLDQGGIAPDPVFLFPADEGGDPVVCIGVECFDPGFDENATRTYWFQDETQ